MIYCAIFAAFLVNVQGGDVWKPADTVHWLSRISGGRSYDHDGLHDDFYAESRSPLVDWSPESSVRSRQVRQGPRDSMTWKDRSLGSDCFGCFPRKRYYRTLTDKKGVVRPFATPFKPETRPDLRERSWNLAEFPEKRPSWIMKVNDRPPSRTKVDSLAHRYPRTVPAISEEWLEEQSVPLVDLDQSWEADGTWSSKDCEEAWLPQDPDACVIARPDDDLYFKIPGHRQGMERLIPRSVPKRPKVSFIEKIRKIIFGQKNESFNETEIISTTTEKPKRMTRGPMVPTASVNVSKPIIVKSLTTTGYPRNYERSTLPVVRVKVFRASTTDYPPMHAHTLSIGEQIQSNKALITLAPEQYNESTLDFVTTVTNNWESASIREYKPEISSECQSTITNKFECSSERAYINEEKAEEENGTKDSIQDNQHSNSKEHVGNDADDINPNREKAVDYMDQEYGGLENNPPSMRHHSGTKELYSEEHPIVNKIDSDNDKPRINKIKLFDYRDNEVYRGLQNDLSNMTTKERCKLLSHHGKSHSHKHPLGEPMIENDDSKSLDDYAERIEQVIDDRNNGVHDSDYQTGEDFEDNQSSDDSTGDEDSGVSSFKHGIGKQAMNELRMGNEDEDEGIEDHTDDCLNLEDQAGNRGIGILAVENPDLLGQAMNGIAIDDSTAENDCAEEDLDNENVSMTQYPALDFFTDLSELIVLK